MDTNKMEIMSNQEVLFKYDDNMDFSLDLSSDLLNETKKTKTTQDHSKKPLTKA